MEPTYIVAGSIAVFENALPSSRLIVDALDAAPSWTAAEVTVNKIQEDEKLESEMIALEPESKLIPLNKFTSVLSVITNLLSSPEILKPSPRFSPESTTTSSKVRDEFSKT